MELNSNDNSVLYIPQGFAHGFMALEDLSEVIYLSSNYYSPDQEKLVNPLDPSLGIEYQLKPILSDKDKGAGLINLED